MSTKKLITVFGATGAQGGGIVSLFLNDPKLKKEWKIRGVTRNVSGESSQKLVAQGVEMITADMNDKPTLVKAMEGSHVVFAVTNYWEYLDMQVEIRQGKNLADAAKEAGVKRYIWSSLLNIKELTNGALPDVYHFDSKAAVESYVRELGLDASFFLAGFYMPNLKGPQGLRPGEDGVWTFSLVGCPPDAPLPLFNPEDTGKFVKGMIANWDEVKGKRVLGATAYETCQEVVDKFKEMFPEAGKTAKYLQMPDEVFEAQMKGAGYPEFAVKELHQNLRLCAEFGYFGGASLDWSQSYVEEPLTTWKEFAKKSWPELK